MEKIVTIVTAVYLLSSILKTVTTVKSINIYVEVFFFDSELWFFYFKFCVLCKRREQT